MASPIPGLGSGPQSPVRPGPGAPAPSDSRARAEDRAWAETDRAPGSPVTASLRAEILSLLPEGERNALAGILSQSRGDDLAAKLEEATKRANDLEKSLAQGRAGLANKFLEQLDELLSVYLLIASMAVLAGRPGMVEQFASQAERIMSAVPGWVSDARAGIAADGNADAAATQQRDLQTRVASITAKARALGNGTARAARIAEWLDGDQIAKSAAAILASADAAEKAAHPEPGNAPTVRDAFANMPGARGGTVSFQV